MKVIFDKNSTLDVNLISIFNVEETNKQYAIYTIEDNDESNEFGDILIAECKKNENGILKLAKIPANERDIVINAYNAFKEQLLEEN